MLPKAKELFWGFLCLPRLWLAGHPFPDSCQKTIPLTEGLGLNLNLPRVQASPEAESLHPPPPAPQPPLAHLGVGGPQSGLSNLWIPPFPALWGSPRGLGAEILHPHLTPKPSGGLQRRELGALAPEGLSLRNRLEGAGPGVGRPGGGSGGPLRSGQRGPGDSQGRWTLGQGPGACRGTSGPREGDLSPRAGRGPWCSPADMSAEGRLQRLRQLVLDPGFLGLEPLLDLLLGVHQELGASQLAQDKYMVDFLQWGECCLLVPPLGAWGGGQWVSFSLGSGHMPLISAGLGTARQIPPNQLPPLSLRTHWDPPNRHPCRVWSWGAGQVPDRNWEQVLGFSHPTGARIPGGGGGGPMTQAGPRETGRRAPHCTPPRRLGLCM